MFFRVIDYFNFKVDLYLINFVLYKGLITRKINILYYNLVFNSIFIIKYFIGKIIFNKFLLLSLFTLFYYFIQYFIKLIFWIKRKYE